MLFRVIIALSIVCSSELEIINQSSSAIIDEIILEQPFLGGMNYPRIEWVDIDYDNTNELLVLDEDACIRLYDYEISDGGSFFSILDTSYGNLCGMSWFSFKDINQDNSRELLCQSLDSANEVQVYSLIEGEFILQGTIIDDNDNPIISDPSMVPTFTDIDSDGDLDFFTGNVVGTVTYYENIGLSDNLPIYELISFEWQNIWVVGPSLQNRHGASAISFIDIDSDGDLDLFWGDYFQSSLYLIYNIGSNTAPLMDISNIISDFPYNDPIYTTGRNMPSFNDIDLDGDLDLFISVLGGDGGIQLSNNFLFYENIENSFYLNSDDFIKTIDLNSDIAPSLVDIDSDGDLDLFIGQDYNTSTFPIRGRIFFFRNVQENSEDVFVLEDDEFLGTNIGNSLIPAFADIDSDGDLDLFIGSYNGGVIFYRNIGNSDMMDFIHESNLEDIDTEAYSSPTFIDIDSDGDLDLFVGENSGKVLFYRNTGSSTDFMFVLENNNFSNIDLGTRSSPNFIDIDSDGDYDLILGSHNQNIAVYRNKGDLYSFNYIQDLCIEIPYYGINTKPFFYSKDSRIYSVTGISTGGAWHSRFNSSLGDLNLDGFLNIQDVLLIVNYIINTNESVNSCLSDINSDTYIDLLDIMLLLQEILD